MKLDVIHAFDITHHTINSDILFIQNRGWRGDRKRNQNKKDDKKSDKKNENDADKDGEESGDKDGPYTGVPTKLMNCFVCCKEMWDGESMKKHVKGIYYFHSLLNIELMVFPSKIC